LCEVGNGQDFLASKVAGGPGKKRIREKLRKKKAPYEREI